MKLWIAIAVLMFATVGHAGKAEAGFYSGNELLERCESANSTKRVACLDYIAGIKDITETYDAWGVVSQTFCIPDSATLGQLQKVAIKGLNAEPEKLHRVAASRVVNIFYAAFPCD